MSTCATLWGDGCEYDQSRERAFQKLLLHEHDATGACLRPGLATGGGLNWARRARHGDPLFSGIIAVPGLTWRVFVRGEPEALVGLSGASDWRDGEQ